jgi:hypothetical protein
MEFLKRKITKDQSRDTGMAMVLLFLLIFVSRKHTWLLYTAMILHVVNMIVPKVFYPIAIFWLGFSDAMGAVMSKVLLSIVYFLVVTPIALLRRISGKDSLKLRVFKSSQESVMVKRDHLFTARDMESPY